jgi:hypothetical protein
VTFPAYPQTTVALRGLRAFLDRSGAGEWRPSLRQLELIHRQRILERSA